MNRIIPIILSFLFITCNNPPNSDLIEWQRNKTKWEKINLSAYFFNFRASCYCIDEWVKEVTITVTADTISSVLFTDNQQTPTQIKPNQLHTVDPEIQHHILHLNSQLTNLDHLVLDFQC